MKLESELDTLRLFAQMHMRFFDYSLSMVSAHDHIEATTEMIKFIGEQEKALLNRYTEVACRAGLLRLHEVTPNLDLWTLDEIVRKNLTRKSNYIRPSNVVDITPRNDVADLARDVVNGDDVAIIKLTVSKAMETILREEKTVVCFIFGIDTEEGKNLNDMEVYKRHYTALKLGFTVEKVGRRYRSAMSKLRQGGRAENLKQCLYLIRRANIRCREEVLLITLFPDLVN